MEFSQRDSVTNISLGKYVYEIAHVIYLRTDLLLVFQYHNERQDITNELYFYCVIISRENMTA